MNLQPTSLAAGPPGAFRLSARLWACPDPRGVLVIAHGHGEHGGCYAEFAGAIVPEANVDVVAFDFRGHGRSAGRRGVIRRYTDLLDDLEIWLGWAAHERPGLPVFVLGHSNGGLVAIRLLETRQPKIAGLILSNPALRLTADAPRWKRWIGEVLLRVAPWVTLQTGIDSDQLTQATESMITIDTDPLRHHRISPPSYFGMVANGPLALLEADRLTAPLFLILGGADPVTDPETGRRFFERASSVDKTLVVHEAMRHEPLHEVDRDEVIAAILLWIGERIDRRDLG